MCLSKLPDKDHTHICCLGYFLNICWTFGQVATIAPCVSCVREEPRCHYPRPKLCRNSIPDRNLEHVPGLVGFSQVTVKGQWV